MQKIIILGSIWKLQQNGAVYSPEGIAPAICCGAHAGVGPKIIEIRYEDNLPEQQG